MTKLRESAKHAPHCFHCFKENPNGDLLCLAHCNELALGRGAYFKTPDIFGAIVCAECHWLIDKSSMPKEKKHEIQRTAHDRTLQWWWDEGYVKAA